MQDTLEFSFDLRTLNTTLLRAGLAGLKARLSVDVPEGVEILEESSTSLSIRVDRPGLRRLLDVYKTRIVEVTDKHGKPKLDKHNEQVSVVQVFGNRWFDKVGVRGGLWHDIWCDAVNNKIYQGRSRGRLTDEKIDELADNLWSRSFPKTSRSKTTFLAIGCYLLGGRKSTHEKINIVLRPDEMLLSFFWPLMVDPYLRYLKKFDGSTKRWKDRGDRDRVFLLVPAVIDFDWIEAHADSIRERSRIIQEQAADAFERSQKALITAIQNATKKSSKKKLEESLQNLTIYPTDSRLYAAHAWGGEEAALAFFTQHTQRHEGNLSILGMEVYLSDCTGKAPKFPIRHYIRADEVGDYDLGELAFARGRRDPNLREIWTANVTRKVPWTAGLAALYKANSLDATVHEHDFVHDLLQRYKRIMPNKPDDYKQPDTRSFNDKLADAVRNFVRKFLLSQVAIATERKRSHNTWPKIAQDTLYRIRGLQGTAFIRALNTHILGAGGSTSSWEYALILRAIADPSKHDLLKAAFCMALSMPEPKPKKDAEKAST